MSLLNLFVILCLYQVQALNFRVQDFGSEKIYFDLNEAKELFDDFIKNFNKKYNNESEYRYRFKVFTKNLEDVNERNNKSDSEVYGITQFLDITEKEFLRDHTGIDGSQLDKLEIANETLLGFAHIQNVPDNWDWRRQGIVSPVRDQGKCGSCWAVSAVACVEGQYARKHKRLLTLSAQQLLDCSRAGSCGGGLPDIALSLTAKFGGIMLESEYSYKSVQGICGLNRKKFMVKINGGKRVIVKNEEHLKQIVYEYGPVVIGLHANNAYSTYKGQIATPTTLLCSPNAEITHAVLLVGYGTENGQPYWIIKNSYGKTWGEQGYMKLLRGVNACSILTYAAIAEVP